MTDVDAWLDDAHLPERTTDVCLRGDLVAQIEALEKQAETVEDPKDKRINSPARRLAKKIEALQKQMSASTRTFRLRALPRMKYTELEAKHPPRTGNQTDKDVGGWNAETFPAALLRACLVDPELSDSQWAKLVDRITQAQYDRLGLVAYELNKRDVAVPFSFTASRILRSSDGE